LTETIGISGLFFLNSLTMNFEALHPSQ